jgi:hypothetical protein
MRVWVAQCTCRGRHLDRAKTHKPPTHLLLCLLQNSSGRRVPSARNKSPTFAAGGRNASSKLMRMMIFWLLLLRKCGKSRPLGEFKRVARSLERGRGDEMKICAPRALWLLCIFFGHFSSFPWLAGLLLLLLLRLFLFIKFATLWRSAHSCETMAECEGL